jgi:hypothetical protein
VAQAFLRLKRIASKIIWPYWENLVKILRPSKVIAGEKIFIKDDVEPMQNQTFKSKWMREQKFAAYVYEHDSSYFDGWPGLSKLPLESSKTKHSRILSNSGIVYAMALL